MHNIFWFRRDLRLEDNAGLYHALKSGQPVQGIFIFDQNILNKLEDRSDARVSFIHGEIARLKSELQALGGDLHVYYGFPEEIWKTLLDSNEIGEVFYNRDYESYALDRDSKIQTLCEQKEVAFKGYKDHVIFEKDEVLKKDGTPYTVFTPYKRRWLERLHSRTEGDLSYYFKAYPNEKYFESIRKVESTQDLISLEAMNFEETDIHIPSKTVPQSIIKKYDKQRNFPAIEGTSRLGIHFRFGTLSIRQKAYKAQQLNDTYLSELIWRDFYSQILSHFPHVEKNAFRAKYDEIEWENNEAHFEAWCKGETGYPMVDAGMRELNNTGHMHNRVRMIVASFLTKHLLIDWRWGEAYFAAKLLDFDLASNNGGWQWAAGSGTDAAPYFRIFNPSSQLDKFDKQGSYVKKWVPEWGTADYAEPIIDHKWARERCLARYKAVLKPEG